MQEKQNKECQKRAPAPRKLNSFLLVSCLKSEMLEEAFACAPDCVVLDMTAAASESPKLPPLDHPASGQSFPALFALVSHPITGKTESDLLRIMPLKPASIVLPMATGYDDIARLAAMIAVAEAEHDLDDGSTAILAVTGASSAGIMNLPTLAAAEGPSRKRLMGLFWNRQAMLSDIGTSGTVSPFNDPTYVARSMTLLAARAMGVCAIDSPCQNPASLAEECRDALAAGFDGKFAAEPSQVRVINEIFSTRQE